jgi:exonuclease SbcD
MRTIRGTFKEITAKAFYEGTATDDYLRIFLTDEDDVHEAMGKLRTIYPNLMELRYDNTRTKANEIIDGAQNVEKKEPIQLFEELFEKQNNQPMSDEQRSFVAQLIDSIREGNV